MSHRQWTECSKQHNLRDKHTLEAHVHIWPVGTRWQPYTSEQGHCLVSSASLHGVWSDLLNWMNLVCYHIVRRFWGRKLWFCLKSMILQFKFCDFVQKQPCPVQGRTFPRVKFCKFGWITKIANFKPWESFMWYSSLCSGCCGVGRLPSSMFFIPFSYPMYCFPRVLLSCWPPTRVAPY